MERMRRIYHATRTAARWLVGLGLAAGLTVALGAPQAMAAEAGSQVSIILEPQADTGSTTDGVDTYRMVVVNRGGGQVKGLTITMPFAAGYRLASAGFSQPDAWVSKLTDGTATIRVEELRGIDDTVVGTLRFTGTAESNALSERATAGWGVEGTSYTTRSNVPLPGVHPLTLGSAEGGLRTVSGTTFAAGEPVNFWYTTAAGDSVPLVIVNRVLAPEPTDDDDEEQEYAEYVTANAGGALTSGIDTTALPQGTYTLAARGSWSGVIAAVTLVVP
jgi:hypothetical protein